MITHKNPHLKALITKHEGEELKPYADSKGITTIGVGHNLEEHGITPEMSQQLLQMDLEMVMKEIHREFPWFVNMVEPRQAAVVDLVFNMGMPVFKKFKKTIALLEERRFKEASEELLRGTGEGGKSRYYVDVGKRAETIAEMIYLGKWPS